MIGIQNRKARDMDKPIPGCLGQMVNLFELRNGVTGKKLLADKPHRDGSSLYRSQSDVARVLSATDDIEDKMIVTGLRRCSSKQATNGTPMKTLLAQEMSKEVESRHRSNVVAKLMGLDALPPQQSIPATHRGRLKGYPRRSLSHSVIELKCWEEDHSFLDKRMQCEGHPCHKQNELKNVQEIWQRSRSTNFRGSSPQKGMNNENIDEKKMALIRQKFMEAKCLATDSGCQSKEFIDAVEVLSSNRDLLLKFLDEPNSMFSRHLYHRETVSPPPRTKRITVLRPSKMVDVDKFSEKKIDGQAKKPAQIGQATGYEKNNAGNTGFSPTYSIERVDEYPSQPTRIVVLKPSPAKIHDIKAVVSPPFSSPRILHGEDIYEHEDDEGCKSREVTKEFTRQMCESVMGHRRDEALLSSVFSNGHIGDASLFNKSENGYAGGNLSDSEITSPVCRHSWDYINKFGSPHSSPCFSRASCSPESSVCREAKKRLSERWAMMTLNDSHQEPKNNRRSSSTLGEMLALSDVTRPVKSEEEGINKEHLPKESTSILISNMNNEEGIVASPKGLLRSKSLPVSSTEYSARLNIEISDSEVGRTEVPKELTKAKGIKSSLKVRVSSLFFSRNKKSTKEKSVTHQFQDESHSFAVETQQSLVPLPGKIDQDATQCPSNSSSEEFLSPGLSGSSIKTMDQDLLDMPKKQGFVSQERGLSMASLVMPGSISENHDHPSPISVLERLFEEDDSITPEPSCDMKPDHQGGDVPLKSNLVGKSPPIGSIARTLSLDNSRAEIAPACPLKPTLTSSGAEEEQYWLFFVQGLLSAAGLDSKAPFDAFFARWHSPESPLDPLLRDKYANFNDKDLLHEAKRRQWRSNRKLGFDCVNAAIMEITGRLLDRSPRPTSWCGDPNKFMDGKSPMLVDHVWAQIKEWFCSEVRCTVGDDGDSNSLVVERVVRKEVVGKGWADNMRVELDLLGGEIEGKLLEELVQEAVVDLTDRS